MPKSINRKLAEVLIPSTTALKESVLDDISAGVTPYATLDDLPTSNLTLGDQAFVTSNQRLYLSNGSGWYNVAMFNATPNLTISPSGVITLATDGTTPTVITLTGTDSDNADANLIYSVESDGSFGGLGTLSQDSSVFTITPLAEGSATPGSSTLTFKVSDGISFGSGTTQFSLTFGPNWATATESKLVASDAQDNDQFGTSVSINSDGTYAIVGAIFEDDGGTNAGAAYIFTKSGSNWTQQQKITASDAQASDFFGYSVSMSSDGSYAIVGAYGEDGGAGDPTSIAGAAYVYVRSGSTWTQQAKLTASDLATQDFFGFSVSINSDATYAIVGARFKNGSATGAGAAYIFTRSGSTWTQQAKITASNAQLYDLFGWSVSINSDATYAIVSSRLDDDGGGDAGAAYIFTRSGSTWTQQAKLTASDAQANDYFGESVSINSNGTYAIVGAYQEDGGAGDPLTNPGAAYVFVRSGSTWTQQQKLVSDDLQSYDDFGFSVSINSDGTYAIVGARYEGGGAGDPLSNAGAAYVFTRSGSSWTQIRKITASDIEANSRLGSAVAISGDVDSSTAITGAVQATAGATANAGAAYIYEA